MSFIQKKILSIFNLIVGVFWGYKGGLSVKGGWGAGYPPNRLILKAKKVNVYKLEERWRGSPIGERGRRLQVGRKEDVVDAEV